MTRAEHRLAHTIAIGLYILSFVVLGFVAAWCTV